MVNSISPQDRDKIEAAIKAIEQTTATKLRVSLHQASDRYQEFILLFALVITSLITLALWVAHYITSYPCLLALQFGLIALMDLVPVLRHLVMRLIPARILRHRAARLAFQDYHAHQSTLAPGTPSVLLFVSLREHYVHIITNPTLHQRIPDNWDSVIATFTTAMKKGGVGAATVQAVENIGAMLQ